MKSPIKYAVYDETKSYDENYAHGPFFNEEIPTIIRRGPKIKLWDFELNSPLGIPAGPLLNSNWIKLYGKLGFDMPTYKTCLLYTSPSPRDLSTSRMPSSA